MKPLLAILLLLLGISTALAASASGYSALAFGAILGSYTPDLDSNDKASLAQLFEGEPASTTTPITVTADAITCRAGNVDITAFACTLTFGTNTVSLTGRSANELFATAAQSGIPSDGAAGTIYESAKNIRCVIDPTLVAQHNGSGADCSFDPQ